MKYRASAPRYQGQDVEISDIPSITFEEVAVPTPDGNIAMVAGRHYWNRLRTDSDLTPLIGQFFNLENDEWKITDCILTVDGTIFFRNAVKIFR